MKRLITTIVLAFAMFLPADMLAQKVHIPAANNLPFNLTPQISQLLDAFATYANQQQKRIWTEKPHPDYISAILQSYKTKADSIIKVVNGTAAFNNYMRLWALQEYFSSIAIVRDISINMFKISPPRLKEWEDKYIISIIDTPQALLFPNSAVYAIGIVHARNFILEKQIKRISKRFKNLEVRSFILETLINGYIDSYNYNNGYQIGLKEITEATATFADQGKKYIDKFMNHRHKMKGADLPNIQLERIDGKRVSLASLAGKPLYIDVWSSKCEHCRKEVIQLKKIEKSYSDMDTEFITISVDKNKEEWKQKVRELKLDPTRQYFAVDDSFPVMMQIESIPHFLIYNRAGKLEHYKAPRPSENNKLYQLMKELQ